MPALVRPLAHLPQGAAVTTLVPTRNEQQQAAIDAHGTVFVAAGAGTGKTTVLVERFVTAVVDDGLDVQSLLVITYTERAAGELRARIRGRLIERGRPDLALRARRRLGLDDPRLLSPAAGRRIRSRRASIRAFACSTSRRRSSCRPRHSASRSSASAPSTSPTAGSSSRPTGQSGCGGCSWRSTRRCARRAGSSVLEPSGVRVPSTNGSPRCARRQLPAGRRACDRGTARCGLRGGRPDRRHLPAGAAAPAISTSRRAARAPPRSTTLVMPSSRPRWRSSPPATASCSRSC